MNGFFKPLRRKLGVAALAVACLVAVGWVRSLNDGDVFCIQLRGDYYSLHSVKGTLRWGRDQLNHVIETTNVNGTSSQLWLHLKANPPSWWQTYHSYEDSRGSLLLIPKYHWHWLIFDLPHSWVVTPLTLLSACLLLSKPRAKKIESPITPASENA